ncbi:MAG: carboxypeptidase-like regulatory domain-containing protein [Bacteroidota bacterium]
MRIPLIIFFLLLSAALRAQNLAIEGRVLDREGREPVAYANIYNKSLQRGSISNSDGYFRIPVSNAGDSVFISFVGYKKQWIIFDGKDKFYNVLLETTPQLLSEVLISAPDDTWLRDLLVECRKRAPGSSAEARSYYELKSFILDHQVELVEGFYNVKMTGYDLSSLDLKAGRLALKPFNNGLFVSMAGSRAITLLKMFGDNPYFPQSPLELSAGNIRKHYYLNLIRKFRDDNSDSLYEIRFTPRDTSGLFFGGKVWLNPATRHILRINLHCPHSKKHPFLPVFNTDEISNVDFNISKTFRVFRGKLLFDHTDFTYDIDYISRMGTTDEMPYRVTTSAVIYAFEYEDLFFIPRFPFTDDHIDDYKKISALPYNDFFWKNYSDYRLSDHLQLNEKFFSDRETITNINLFTQHRVFSLGLFENSFLNWSAKRILLKENTPVPSDKRIGDLDFPADQYNLSVKIFMDINTDSDSTHILTATILDPMESFYLLPMDNITHCFINIWFDLVEAERRRFEKELELSDKNGATVQGMYDALLLRIKTLKQQYMKETERGTRLEELKKWNRVVYKYLGIDNMEFFHLNEN